MEETSLQIYTKYFKESMRELYLEIAKLNIELEKYKKIEEELGCPIEIIFKALKDGIYTNKGNFNPCDYLSFHNEYIYSDYEPNEYFLKDYKKTWWLKKTKEE